MDYSVRSALIEHLRQKQDLTAIERDILDTADELLKNPFDRETAERQVKKNDLNHPDIFAAFSALPTTVVRPFSEATDADIRYSLNHQINALITKELKAKTVANKDVCRDRNIPRAGGKQYG